MIKFVVLSLTGLAIGYFGGAPALLWLLAVGVLAGAVATWGGARGWWPDRRMSSTGDTERWVLWRWVEIHSQDGQGSYSTDAPVYLLRLILARTPFGSAMLHWLLRPDPDRHLHDHPWDFLSVPLCGRYVEERIDGSRRHRYASCWNLKLAHEAHRIVAVSGSSRWLGERTPITLVLCGPKRRTWGFWTEDGWVPWRTYCFGDQAARHESQTAAQVQP